MSIPAIADLIPVLQTAVGPVILISGFGLLLLTMTNRLGRVIDRSRELAGQAVNEAGPAGERLKRQIRILWKRARLIRAAIALLSVSVLSAALLVIMLFAAAQWGMDAAGVIVGLFAVCMLSLIASLVVFIHDINRALCALKLELHVD